MEDASARASHPSRTLIACCGPAVALLAALVLLVVAATTRSSAESADGPRGTSLAAQLERGQAVYAFSCTTCHGATGSGFAEARAAFPDDHYQCSRCHMPLNPPVMTQQQIDQTQSVFSLGDAPPLNDPHALARLGSAVGLHGYVRATMPRWDPGRLDDDAYIDVTVFVLSLAGLLPERADAISLDDLPGVALGRGPGDGRP